MSPARLLIGCASDREGTKALRCSQRNDHQLRSRCSDHESHFLGLRNVSCQAVDPCLPLGSNIFSIRDDWPLVERMGGTISGSSTDNRI